jgi:3-methyladenine DNA glycosylase AlkD
MNAMKAKDVEDALQVLASKVDALVLQKYFKTGPGQYGEGDIFIGVRIPQIRSVCKKYNKLQINEVQKLLDSKVHEHRMAALIILVAQYRSADASFKELIYEQYLKNVYKNRINNWDLVDLSALYIVGEHLQNRPRDLLFSLAKSENLWQRRVALLSSFNFIKSGDSTTSIELAEYLLYDNEDLIQKAVGWMLREIGKRCDKKILLTFLDKHAHDMPRTTLRYSIEHLSTEQKQHYLKLKNLRNI